MVIVIFLLDSKRSFFKFINFVWIKSINNFCVKIFYYLLKLSFSYYFTIKSKIHTSSRLIYWLIEWIIHKFFSLSTYFETIYLFHSYLKSIYFFQALLTFSLISTKNRKIIKNKNKILLLNSRSKYRKWLTIFIEIKYYLPGGGISLSFTLNRGHCGNLDFVLYKFGIFISLYVKFKSS